MNNWFDRDDLWTVPYPYVGTVYAYTTFYVPAGHGVDYNNKDYYSNYYYHQWGEFFGNIKEFGADADDNVFGMKCDTIPELMHYADSLMGKGMMKTDFAYGYLMQYVDSIAQSEGKEPDYAQVEAAFDKLERSGEGGTYTIPIIPEINRIMNIVYNLINQADQLCDDMKEQRKEYYEAKNAYEIRLKYYPNDKWEYYKADVERKKVALESKIAEMNNKVRQAAIELAYLVDLGDSLFVKEVWDFINAFKLKTSVISPTITNVQNGRQHWYTLDGKHLDGPSKGINIINGKKIMVK